MLYAVGWVIMKDIVHTYESFEETLVKLALLNVLNSKYTHILCYDAEWTLYFLYTVMTSTLYVLPSSNRPYKHPQE